MKHLTYIIACSVLAIGLTSCGADPEPENEPEVQEQLCTYSYNEGTSKLEWTSYKTSDKVPVAGSFNQIEVTSESSDDPKTVLESISFVIQTSSVETNNEDRNGKIAEHFFGTNNTEQIEGEIKSLSDNGKAVIAITMNDITFDVEGDYTLDGADFTYSATIDMESWNGLGGIEALNTVCKDLHTGEDGVSKLWSEIGLSFSTTLKSDCN